MAYSVRILARARADVDHILNWISTTMKSPAGAQSWLGAFEIGCEMLAEDPHRFPLAAEDEAVAVTIQQLIFKTRKGRRYRIVFTVNESDVFILRVRGPGQPPLTDDEIAL